MKVSDRTGQADLKVDDVWLADITYVWTKEGWLYVVAEGKPAWRALCKAIDHEGVLSDGRFASAELRAENDGDLAKLLSDIFARHTAAEWLPVLKSAGIPASE